ncbi:MAG TPA: amylo-alpha-1,6-glucosidase, partial [Candidatus Limnocylindrales bacterium]|nr:amylo-alpha-1,6-glucosidase [Candidatus Limnocylindrales bacterium]
EERVATPDGGDPVRLIGGRDGTLVEFRLEGMLPVWTHAVAGGTIERRVWADHGVNATSVRYELCDGARPVRLSVVPLVTARDHHDPRPRRGNSRPPVRQLSPRHAIVRLVTPVGPIDLDVTVDHGSLHTDGPGLGRWHRRIPLPEETARGLPDRTAGFAGLGLEAVLEPGRPLTLTVSVATRGRGVAASPAGPAASPAVTDARGSLAAAQDRQLALIRAARAETAPPVTRQLVLAADQFLVPRAIPDPDGGTPIHGRSVIAGYPWFNDWGRDTMIALPGLTLATGRAGEAAAILRSFARFRRRGLLPNNFPDDPDDRPGYHTIDAPLAFVAAVGAYDAATADRSLVDDLLPGIVDGLEWYVRGTDFGIGLDAADGLVRGAAPGLQLTWMDAKVDDWVVTPRRGKPVEIQGLWHNALRLVVGWLGDRGRAAEAARWSDLADRARASFAERFWRPELGYLADVVDGPDGDAVQLRPNQLLAMSQAHPIFDGEPARRALAACRDALLTPVGLRSLAPSDPGYRPTFQGDRRHRDAAYHNGAVWSWLIGPYVDAVLRVTGDVDQARSAIEPFTRHLSDGGLGSIAEIFEPEDPFEPRGCVAQAWGVAEVLRVRRVLEANAEAIRPPRPARP